MKKRKNSKGFSLIELIIAIAILVILTGLLAPQFMRYMEKSREAKDMQVLDTIYGAVQVALTNEDAYAAVTSGKAGAVSDLTSTGMSLVELLKQNGDKNALLPFFKEFCATMGIQAETKEPPIFSPWVSKAVMDANSVNDWPDGCGSAVYIQVDKDMKVTVWIGNQVASEAEITSKNALSPTPILIKKIKNGGGPGTEKTVQTVGTTFFISK